MPLRQLSSHLAVPLYRNGYALVANTVVTSGLGALYWVVAARSFSAEAVGINAAALSAMVLIANLSQLNLANALNRFVPDAGGRTGWLIYGAYAVATPLAAVVSIVFLIGQPSWAPGLDILRSSPLAIVGFVLATMGWTVFVLQDAALTGLRRATWIPPENAVYSLAKIGLLLGFAVSAPSLGIFASATLPLLFVIVPINILIYRRAVPHHVGARFAAADFFASLSWRVTVGLMPVLVLSLAGAEANAYFFLASTIAYTLFLIGKNTGMSLITEAALAPHKLQSFSRKVLIQTSGIVIPAAAALVAFAPVVLRIFGPDYAREGSTVLRLLVLSAIPHTVISLNVSILRAERRMGTLAVLQGAMAILVIVLSVVLLPILGINGVGWAWLATTTVVAVAVLATNLRFLWFQVLLEGPLGRRIVVRGRASRLSTSTVPPAVTAAVESTLTDLRQSLGMPKLRLVGCPGSGSDLAVATVGVSSAQPEMVVKMARTESASATLLRETDALSALHTDPRVRGLARLVPNLVASGLVGDRRFVTLGHIGGSDGRTADLSDHPHGQLLIAAAGAIAGLHRATGSLTTLADDDLARLVDLRLEAAFREGRLQVGRRQMRALDRLGSELRSATVGLQVPLSWIHGDYWLGNVVVDRAGQPCGIIDWDGMEVASLPAIDMVHLILTTRANDQNRELGSIVLEALDAPGLSDAELAVMAMLDGPNMEDGVSWRSLVLLTWLHHVTSRARRWRGRPARWLWTARNVGEVLEAL